MPLWRPWWNFTFASSVHKTACVLHGPIPWRDTLLRVCTDPGKVWKVMEFKVEIFQVWKIIENDLRYGKVIESVTYGPGKLRCSLHWWLLQHLLIFLHFMSQRKMFFHNLSRVAFRNIHWHQQSRLFCGLFLGGHRVHNRECCESCEEESVRQTAAGLPSVLQKLPKSSCCQAAEQDCHSVSTSKLSCIPGSLTYIQHRQEQDTSEVCIAPVSAV